MDMTASMAVGDAWLIRGLPLKLTEDEVVELLLALGFPVPIFWYLPVSRKPSQHNRGYGFLRFSSRQLEDAMHVAARSSRRLQAERSTAVPTDMVNNVELWKSKALKEPLSGYWEPVLLPVKAIEGGSLRLIVHRQQEQNGY
eukprot:s3751_g1.t1